MGRLIMGHKSITNYSTIAVHETAKLFNFQSSYPVAFKALVEDTYVDNVLIAKYSLEEIENGIKDMEYVAGHGNMFLKPWVISTVSSLLESQ